VGWGRARGSYKLLANFSGSTGEWDSRSGVRSQPIGPGLAAAASKFAKQDDTVPDILRSKERRATHLSRIGWTLAVMSTVGLLYSCRVSSSSGRSPKRSEPRPPALSLLNDVAKIQHLVPTSGTSPGRRNLIRIDLAARRIRWPWRRRRQKGKGGRRAPREAADHRLLRELGRCELRLAQEQRPASRLGVTSWLYLLGDNMDLRITLDDKALELIRREKPQASILAMIQNSSAYQWTEQGWRACSRTLKSARSASKASRSSLRPTIFKAHRRLRTVPRYRP